MIADILKTIHRGLTKDIDYPEAGSEDMLVRLDYVNKAISTWEACVREGYIWKELIVPATEIVFGGTGTDPLPANFLSFIQRFDQSDGFKKAELQIGNSVYSEVKASEGEQMAQQGLAPYVFWSVSGNIRTLPAANGSINTAYLKKATRYATGAETEEPEMQDTSFIEDFVLAMQFLDNGDNDLYSMRFTLANETLKNMKYNALA